MKKTLSILVIAIIALVLCMGTVNAANDTLTAVVSADKTEVKQGETVTVTLSLKDFVEGETGISALVATLKYDKTVFETVKMADFSMQNGWIIGAYNENEGSFTATNSTFPDAEHAVLKLALKVKDEGKTGNTTVSFTEINPANASKDFTAADKSVTIAVSAKANSGDNNGDNNGGNNGDNNGGNNGGNNNGTNNGSDNNSNNGSNSNGSSKTLPNTGAESFIIPAIVAVAAVGIVAYIRYNRVDK